MKLNYGTPFTQQETSNILTLLASMYRFCRGSAGAGAGVNSRQATLPDAVFKRMFRMNKASFGNLCSRICLAVGEETFLSESHLATRSQPRTQEATQTVGGVVCGEIKVALTLRILAGSSYLDLTSKIHFFHNTVLVGTSRASTPYITSVLQALSLAS